MVTRYTYYGQTLSLPSVFVYQSGNIVYYYNDYYSNFFPLYYFNVSKGDTLSFHCPRRPYYPKDSIWHVVVDSVTSLIVGADTLKTVWNTTKGQWTYRGSYTEKLGSAHLMLPTPLVTIPEENGPLRCYSDSKISYNRTILPCDYREISSIEELRTPTFISLFPNPASKQININIAPYQQYNYVIYNSVGQIKSKGNSTEEFTKFEVGDLANGVYYLQLTSHNYIQQRSFIIEK